MNMQVYGFWRSIASFRVRGALRLKGLPFEEIPIDILSGEQFKPGYDDVNAEHVVPTFVHDGHCIFQSLAIIEYLDEIQPEPRLATYERLLTRRPAAPFALGAEPGMADICVAGQAVSAHLFKLELNDFPAVSRLVDRCFALPAFATSHPFEQPGFKDAN